MLLYLYKNDKETVFNVIYPDFDAEKLSARITRDSVKNLCNLIIKVTAKREYTILIDSLDNITNKGVQTLEFLKDHFVIIGAAREIKIEKSSFIWNFDIIKLKNLQRPEAIDLIHRLSYNLQVDDLDVFKNHVYEQTDGNPRAIYEMCDRYQKETHLSTARIREIKHIGAVPEMDCTLIVLIFLAVVACLRCFFRVFWRSHISRKDRQTCFCAPVCENNLNGVRSRRQRFKIGRFQRDDCTAGFGGVFIHADQRAAHFYACEFCKVALTGNRHILAGAFFP